MADNVWLGRYPVRAGLVREEYMRERTRELLEAFKAAHGTTCCRELLAHLETLKTEPSARTAQYYKERPCARYVETAARLIEEMDERTDAAP